MEAKRIEITERQGEIIRDFIFAYQCDTLIQPEVDDMKHVLEELRDHLNVPVPDTETLSLEDMLLILNLGIPSEQGKEIMKF